MCSLVTREHVEESTNNGTQRTSEARRGEQAQASVASAAQLRPNYYRLVYLYCNPSHSRRGTPHPTAQDNMTVSQ